MNDGFDFMTIGSTYSAAPSGLLLPDHVLTKRYKPAPRITGVDVFCGAGGFSCGVMQAGVEVVAAIEYDCAAAMTYMTNLCRWGEVQIHYIEPRDRERMEATIRAEYKRAGVTITKDGQIRVDGKTSWRRVPIAGSGWIGHLPDMPAVKHMFIGDVRKLDGARLLKAIGMDRGELGCMFGGPPCQGFSTSGKRHVMDPRNSLVFEFARLIVQTSPKAMAMENVPGILTMVTPDGIPVVDAFTRILEDGGFGGYESFLRSIQAQTGSIGLLRGKKRPKNRRSSGRRGGAEAYAEEGEDDCSSR